MQAPTVPQQAQQPVQQQQQPLQYSIPPAPTFASLGGNSMALTGSLGTLAQGQQPHSLPTAQGLSAAIPPSAYLMQQTYHQSPQQYAQPAAEKKTVAKREDANFGLVLPLHKIKKLIKSEGNVKAVSGEASFAIARATELFLEQVLQRGYQSMAAQSRASLEYEDLSDAVTKWPATDFLRDVVPQAIPLKELVERLKQQDAAKKAEEANEET